jgi:3',5'-cyclic AMP phosphodiesterase CpdA
MKLWAISDLHLSSQVNRDALEDIADHDEDWLILAGDIAERFGQGEQAFRMLQQRFAQLIWVPGNHDLWSVRRENEPNPPRGDARYREWLRICRENGVLTPEDPFPVWQGETRWDAPTVIAPLFLLYDYSFRPPDVPMDGLRAWAREHQSVCSDEIYLNPEPHASRQAWCAALVKAAEERLMQEIPAGARTVLVNHWPLTQEVIYIPRVPRFAAWCGTTLTADWHTRFNAAVAVSGHLHTRRTDMIDGTRFEEVSLGYPRHWNREAGIGYYLREILPGPVEQDLPPVGETKRWR